MRAGYICKGDSLQTFVRANVVEKHKSRSFVLTDIVFHRPVPELCGDDLEYLSSYPSVT
jgi:hypothetical protein